MKWLLVVVLCVAAASARSHGATDARQDHQLREVEREVKANMNEYFDDVIAQMRIFMQENGLVPMSLPDSLHGFSVRFMFVTWHGELELTKGQLSGLTTLHRQGDADLSYENGTMIIRADIGFDLMQFEYDYLAYVMNIGPDGGINGVVQGLTLTMAIEVDLFGDRQELKELELVSLGKLKVWLTGTAIIDPIANAIVGVITLLYEDSIAQIVVSAIKDAINGALENTPPPTSPAPLVELAAQTGGGLANIPQQMWA